MSGAKRKIINSFNQRATEQLVTVRKPKLFSNYQESDEDDQEGIHSFGIYTKEGLASQRGNAIEVNESNGEEPHQQVDVKKELPSGTSSESSDNDGVVYEETLKHRSFTEKPRQRRSKYMQNRKSGVVPKLHFTGSRKTEFWRHYGVDPNKILLPGNTLSIDAIFADNEFKKLGPRERRIHVNGQKFKILNNHDKHYSLYRAVAQAVGIPEEEYSFVREAILDSLENHWSIFCKPLCDLCGKQVTEAEAAKLNPKAIIDIYKKLDWARFSPPELELIAAGLHYDFSYTIIEVWDVKTPTVVRNCQSQLLPPIGAVKYHFLKAGKEAYFELLVPIGPPKRLQDGQYLTIIRDVLLVQKYQRKPFSGQTWKEKYQPDIGHVPIGFALDHRTFFYRATVSHDLWSLLAELMFKKLVHAPQIKHRITDRKHDYALCYLACKAKKRYQVHGSASVNRLTEDFTDLFSNENSRGDLEDLAQAATYFDFSYTILGLDFKGNFFWRDYVSKKEVTHKNAPYLAFFVKTTADKLTFWYGLEDIGRSCPKERKHYQSVHAGDLTQWGGRFYFHDHPKQSTTTTIKRSSTGSSSSRHLFRVPTELFSQAAQWTTSNLSRLSSTLVTTVSKVSLKPVGFLRRILNTFMRFTRKKKINTDKNVQAVYVRERP